jgi:hypothetical protein
MTAKKKTASPAKPSANTLQITLDGKSQERKMAELGLSAPTLNTVTATIYAKGHMGELDLTEAISVMREKVDKVKKGELSELEATLTAQAVSLDAIFNELARRAASNMGKYMNAFETYMRLALKAQAQTVRTIEVLAAVKNPPIVFAKQANISHGHQQVNNGTNTAAPAHAGKAANQQNELLEVNHGSQAVDSGTAQTAIGKDQAMAAVE